MPKSTKYAAAHHFCHGYLWTGPTAIAEAVERKDRLWSPVFGIPAHLLPSGIRPRRKTSRETVELTVKLIEAIGKRRLP